MAKYIQSISGRNEPVTLPLLIGASQTIAEGDLIQITAGKGVAAVSKSETLFGIAQRSITTGAAVSDKDNIPVVLLDGVVIEIDTTGGDITDADLNGSKVYDISNKRTLNVLGITDGMLKILDYDNARKKALVVVSRANLALQ